MLSVEENPTGFAYLKTFQALFQLVEIVLMLLAWTLLASQPFFLVSGLSFSLGIFLITWLFSLFFFIIYVTGTHVKFNNWIKQRKSNSDSTGEGTSRSLAPSAIPLPSVAWFVVEYVIYFVAFIFLFIAVCIETAKAGGNTHLIASFAFAWLSLIVYVLHFCLLVRNTEGRWPHQCFMECVETVKAKKQGENASLLPSTSHPSAPTEEP